MATPFKPVLVREATPALTASFSVRSNSVMWNTLGLRRQAYPVNLMINNYKILQMLLLLFLLTFWSKVTSAVAWEETLSLSSEFLLWVYFCFDPVLSCEDLVRSLCRNSACWFKVSWPARYLCILACPLFGRNLSSLSWLFVPKLFMERWSLPCFDWLM